MKRNYSFLEWSLVILLAGIWGSSFILMKRGLESFPPEQVAAIRLSSAFLIMLPLIATKIRDIPLNKWKYIFISGVVGNGIPAFLFSLAQTRISSSLAGILNSLTPLFALLISVLIFKNKLLPMHGAGVLLGFAGALVLLIFKADGSIEGGMAFGFLCVLGTFMYGISVNVIKNFLQEQRPLLISGFAIGISGIPYGLFLMTTDFTQRLSNVPGAWSSLGFVIILGVVGTAISLVLFNKLIKTTSVLFASSVTYLMPVVALFWGFTENEGLGLIQIFGLGAILGGIYLVNRH